MANNRMWLRCRGCGKEFFLGKRFGEGYFIEQYEIYKGVPLIDRLNKFYSEHEWCGDEGLDCFELHYEDEPAPKTNADKLRSMTDEELADFLAVDVTCPCVACGSCNGHASVVTIGECHEHWAAWLKKEVEDGGTDQRI